MKVELHLHTHRYSPCAHHTPAEAMERLIRAGYGAVYITEHDAVWSDWELEELASQFPPIRVFPGVEVATSPLPDERFQHLLVLGTNDRRYVELADRPAEILARAAEEGCLTVLAHPYRWPGSAQMLKEGLLPDALEYHTCNHDSGMAEQARLASAELSLPLVNAGDVHALNFIGRFWTETDQPLQAAKDIRGIVLAGKYRNCTSAD